MQRAIQPLGELTGWLRRHAVRLRCRLCANVRRSLAQREVAMHGACLLLLVALVAFAPSSPIAVLLALAMLWALSPEQRLGAQRPGADRVGLPDNDGKADDEATRTSAPVTECEL